MRVIRRTALALTACLLVLAGTPKSSPADTAALEAEFKQTCNELIGKRIAGTKELVIGKEGWVLLTSELHYAGAPVFWGAEAAAVNRKAKPELADPIPAIVDFNNQLKDRGITLYLMPAPIRELVYPESILGSEKIPPDRQPPYLHSVQSQFYETLRKQGVTVVDLLPLLLERRHHEEHGRLYCPSETHWTSYTVSLASKELARLITRQDWYAGVEKQQLSASWRSWKHTGSIYKKLQNDLPELPEYDEVELRRVRYASGEKIEARNPESPVVLIGDSYTTWWRQFSAALPHQLAYELSFPVDQLSTSGGGATETRLNLIRAIRSHPGYLDGKKVVIWCFSARSLVTTGEGWVTLPLVPTNQPPAQPAGQASKVSGEG